MTDPIVTVVIPTRDRRDLLHRALRSVLDQTVPDIEIIVVDDGSESDLGLAEPRFAERVTVVRNPSAVGAQQSRLIGARKARAPLLALLDSDDWWSRDKLEKQLAVAAAHDNAVISCRVTVANGTLRIAAPWRTLRRDERVEDYLYVWRGMLQTSTMLAQTGTLISLLEQSAGHGIHNDTMLFLEAQRRQLPIIQMEEPLSFFDDNPRADRISYDARRVTASLNWFNDVSGDWSPEARAGFTLIDTVTRYVNAGQRGEALYCLLHAYHPKLSFNLYMRKIAYVFFNGSPKRFLKEGILSTRLFSGRYFQRKI
jgi:glycosyltransferase involved in cell wall biosynthesis